MIDLLKFWREGLIVVLLLALAGQQVRVAGEKSAHQKTKADHAKVLQTLAEKTSAVYKAVLTENEAHARELAALDAKRLKELQDAKTENDRLAECVRTGKCGLRVRAVCPAAGGGVPQTAPAASVADAAGPRLDDAAERDYFRLRERISVVTKQVEGLQEYIRRSCVR